MSRQKGSVSLLGVVLSVLVGLVTFRLALNMIRYDREYVALRELQKQLKDELKTRKGVWQTVETLCSQTPGGSCTLGYKQYPDPDRAGEKFTQLFFKTKDGRCYLFHFGEKIEDCKILSSLVP